MTQQEFIQENCGSLTPIQTAEVEQAIRLRAFVGVGRALGRSQIFPVINKGHSACAVTEIGSFHYCPVASIIPYTPEA